MKKYLLTLFMVLALLFLVACEGAVDENSEIRNNTTQTENLTQAQEVPSAHLPSWAENLELSEDEVYTMHTSFDWYWHDSIDEMTSWSGCVARVEVLDERVELVNTSPRSSFDTYDIVTIHRLRALEVFKGNAQAGETIEAMQVGGSLGNLILICEEMASLVSGDELIVFINEYGCLLNPMQSIYRVPSSARGNESLTSQSENITLENVHEKNNLVLTTDDLEKIAQVARTTQ